MPPTGSRVIDPGKLLMNLRCVCSDNNIYAFQRLLDLGIDPFMVDNDYDGSTCYHIISKEGNADMMAILLTRMLLKYNHDHARLIKNMQIKDHSGFIGLHYAVFNDHYRVISVITYFDLSSLYIPIEGKLSLVSLELMHIFNAKKSLSVISKHYKYEINMEKYHKKLNFDEFELLQSKFNNRYVMKSNRSFMDNIDRLVSICSMKKIFYFVEQNMKVLSSLSFYVLLLSLIAALAVSLYIPNYYSVIAQIPLWVLYILACVKHPGTICNDNQTTQPYSYEAAITDIINNKYNNNKYSGKPICCHVCRSRVDYDHRASHSMLLNQCIPEYDHYCTFVKNEIGRDNYVYFFGFLLALLVNIPYHVYVTYVFAHSNPSTGSLSFNFKRFLIFFSAWCCLVFCLVFLLFISTLYETVRGFTSCEAGNPARYFYIQNDSNKLMPGSCWSNILCRLFPSNRVKYRQQLRSSELDIKYEFRSLKLDELDQWYHFCATSFSHKPNPPSPLYFRQHYECDPYADVQLIYVAVQYSTNSIVGSVRLFPREIYVDCRKVHAVGLGEVCTAASHRDEGISSKLLSIALNDATHKYGYGVALLHANKTLWPFYQRLAFTNIKCPSSLICIPANSNFTSMKKIDIKNYSREISELCNTFCAQFNGCVYKSDKYVLKWVDSASPVGVVMLQDSKIVAYAVLVSYNNSIQLKDFAINSNDVYMNTQIGTLVAHFLAGACKLLDLVSDDAADVDIVVPTPLLDALQLQNVVKDPIVSENGSWMYRPLAASSLKLSGKDNLIWKIDNF